MNQFLKISWTVLQVIAWLFIFIVNPLFVIIVGGLYLLLKHYVSFKSKKPCYVNNIYYETNKRVERTVEPKIKPIEYTGYLN